MRSDLLVWIDLEMSGLDPEKEVILEIAAVITDNNLQIIDKTPSYVIQQPEIYLNNMHPVVMHMHTKSNLINEVKNSQIPLSFAQELVLSMIKEHCNPGTALLCGNTIWMDRLFLSRYMPEIVSYLHYRMIDVSSIKEVIKRWYPNNRKMDFPKKEGHRALQDILESIEELNHYRQNFFV